ncbi:geranylgeranyl pyrophosphate synthetase [Penicillium hispanicum]|uniref:geranylgeranyl pyrophosphate synthetase n=1 Tax=Penicillium hispanicum TaxID=1080232 RepID=UPI002542690F|nr:geranylgeranyl pyrophosphate synthetase [Penicillium hispanicum]KAJ5586715.1 geranylgeranyl pyrophosphate synthetase [Penicillium hispanicum]
MSDTTAAPAEQVEISRLTLECVSSGSVSITEVNHLASYNWIETSTPTIAVPGSPARWSAPKGPRRVKKDSGLVYIAQNAARYPESPLEPLFRALYTENPSFDIQSIDLVTDRNNIRKLLSFVTPGLARDSLEPFTIQVEVANNTVIFCRDETATYDIIGPGDFRGFGREFEKAYTVHELKNSTGHHRVISYSLADLKLLVRHETDGYVAHSATSSNVPDSTSDNLSQLLESLSLTTESISPHSRLRMRKEGQAIPRELTLEIKTRVSRKPLLLEEVIPQLWLSQTPKLVRAYHQRGMFAMPQVEDVTTEIQLWEKSHQQDLKKLTALINKILQVSRIWGGNSTIRYDAQKDRLVIQRAGKKRMLPEDLYLNWTKVAPQGEPREYEGLQGTREDIRED